MTEYSQGLKVIRRLLVGLLLFGISVYAFLNGVREHAFHVRISETASCEVSKTCGDAHQYEKVLNALDRFCPTGCSGSRALYLQGLGYELAAVRGGDNYKSLEKARNAYHEAATKAVADGEYWLATMRKNIALGLLSDAERALVMLLKTAPYELRLQRVFLDDAFRLWGYWSEGTREGVRKNVGSSLRSTQWGDEYIEMAFRHGRAEVLVGLLSNDHQRSVYAAYSK